MANDISKPVILVVEPDDTKREALAAMLEEAGFDPHTAATGPEALDRFYAQPPRCLLIRHQFLLHEKRTVLEEIKSDNVYGHLPAIVILTPEDIGESIDWEAIPADDYLVEPFEMAQLASRLRICWARAQRDVHANPLTGLPGNLTITREAEWRLAGEVPFAFAYLDLDHFKAYNDCYGFSRGDEVLRMTARVLVNVIRSLRSDNTYVGHIGGDDFVFITPPDLMRRACQDITVNFDLIVPSFYDEEDRVRGFVQSIDRQGNPKSFPLMSCSIGVVDTLASKLTHIAELFSRVTEMKSVAKNQPSSNYVIDRRK